MKPLLRLTAAHSLSTIIYVNPEHIVSVFADGEDGTRVVLASDHVENVRETVETIQAMHRGLAEAAAIQQAEATLAYLRDHAAELRAAIAEATRPNSHPDLAHLGGDDTRWSSVAVVADHPGGAGRGVVFRAGSYGFSVTDQDRDRAAAKARELRALYNAIAYERIPHDQAEPNGQRWRPIETDWLDTLTPVEVTPAAPAPKGMRFTDVAWLRAYAEKLAADPTDETSRRLLREAIAGVDAAQAESGITLDDFITPTERPAP